MHPNRHNPRRIFTLADARDERDRPTARQVREDAAAQASRERLAREDADLVAYSEIGYLVIPKGRLYYAFLDGYSAPETKTRDLAALIIEIDARHACDQEGVAY